MREMLQYNGDKPVLKLLQSAIAADYPVEFVCAQTVIMTSLCQALRSDRETHVETSFH